MDKYTRRARCLACGRTEQTAQVQCGTEYRRYCIDCIRYLRNIGRMLLEPDGRLVLLEPKDLESAPTR